MIADLEFELVFELVLELVVAVAVTVAVFVAYCFDFVLMLLASGVRYAASRVVVALLTLFALPSLIAVQASRSLEPLALMLCAPSASSASLTGGCSSAFVLLLVTQSSLQGRRETRGLC